MRASPCLVAVEANLLWLRPQIASYAWSSEVAIKICLITRKNKKPKAHLPSTAVSTLDGGDHLSERSNRCQAMELKSGS